MKNYIGLSLVSIWCHVRSFSVWIKGRCWGNKVVHFFVCRRGLFFLSFYPWTLILFMSPLSLLSSFLFSSFLSLNFHCSLFPFFASFSPSHILLLHEFPPVIPPPPCLSLPPYITSFLFFSLKLYIKRFHIYCVGLLHLSFLSLSPSPLLWSPLSQCIRCPCSSSEWGLEGFLLCRRVRGIWGKSFQHWCGSAEQTQLTGKIPARCSAITSLKPGSDPWTPSSGGLCKHSPKCKERAFQTSQLRVACSILENAVATICNWIEYIFHRLKDFFRLFMPFIRGEDSEWNRNQNNTVTNFLVKKQ